MQRNMLHAYKVLPARQALGQSECDLRFAAAGPCHLAAGESGALRKDFEPHVSGAVECCGCFALGDFGEVELERTGVRNG